MIIGAAAYGPADNDYSSAYFKQFHQSIEANAHITEGVARTGYDETYGSNRLVGSWISRQNTLIKVSKTDYHALVQLLLSIRSTHMCFSHHQSVEVISSFHDIEDRTKCWRRATRST